MMSEPAGIGCWLLISAFFMCMVVLAPAQTDLVNIAYQKPTNQTGAFGGAKADRAVDGRYDKEPGDDYLRVCAYPDATWDDNTAANWWLDLEHVYSIHNVTVYNTYNKQAYKRLNNFSVHLISEDGTKNASCGFYGGADPVGRGGNHTFACQEREGRYLLIAKSETDGDRQHLILCEVEVSGTPSENVTTSSPAMTSSTTWSDASSTETTMAEGTSLEASTPSATSDCPAGLYGENCEQKCGNCAPFEPPVYNPCHRTGKCINGCIMWWTGDKCQQDIASVVDANKQVKVQFIGSDRAELEVEQVDVRPSLCAFYGYELVYGGKSYKVPHDGNRTTVIVTLTDLSYNTEYNVTVKPYRVMQQRYQYGTSYPDIRFKTKCIEPGVPAISAITVDDTIKVKYQVPNITGCDNLTRIDIFYRLIDQNDWTRVVNNTGQHEAEVKVAESVAYVFKVVATNNKDLRSSDVSPIVKVTKKPEKSTSSKATLLPWSLLVGSFVLNVCFVTFLFTAYCGRSGRRRRRSQSKQTKSDKQRSMQDEPRRIEDRQFGIANEQFGMTEPRFTAEYPQDNVEVEYATHISDVTEDSVVRPEKDKKMNSPDHAYNDWTIQYNSSSVQMTSDLEDYEYTRHIGDKNRKKAQKVKRVKKVKKERKRIAPHYNNSDMQENEYAVVF